MASARASGAAAIAVEDDAMDALRSAWRHGGGDAMLGVVIRDDRTRWWAEPALPRAVEAVLRGKRGVHGRQAHDLADADRLVRILAKRAGDESGALRPSIDVLWSHVRATGSGVGPVGRLVDCVGETGVAPTVDADAFAEAAAERVLHGDWRDGHALGRDRAHAALSACPVEVRARAATAAMGQAVADRITNVNAAMLAVMADAPGDAFPDIIIQWVLRRADPAGMRAQCAAPLPSGVADAILDAVPAALRRRPAARRQAIVAATRLAAQGEPDAMRLLAAVA